MKNLKNALSKTLKSSQPWAIWIWNLSITKEEIEKQLNAFISKGFGGIAVRPGRDMSPGYMTDEFLNHFGHVLEIARQNKIGIRLADDFSLLWGGSSDSIVRHGRKAQAEYLVLDRVVPCTESEIEIDPNCEYIAQSIKKSIKTGMLLEVKQVGVPTGKSSLKWKGGQESSLLLYKKVLAYDPAGRVIPNIYNIKAGQIYAQNTLDVIRTRFSKYIPTTFEGFVTEIPALRPGGNGIFWDDDMVVKYRTKYKRDLLALLPYVFLDIPGAEKHRIQIHNVIGNLMGERFVSFLEAWAKRYRLSQWTLWPETGMYKPENALVDGFVPEAPLATVGLQNNDGSLSNYALLRTAADVNTAYRRRETVTVIGRNRNMFGASLQDLKREIDLSLLAGPSRILFDGFYFNIDQRNYYKTPFNPFWYSPDWEYMKSLCDYVRRNLDIISNIPHASREIAVLCPTDFIMSSYMPGNSKEAAIGFERFQKTIGALCCFGKEFDIVTEELLLSCMMRQSGEFTTPDRIRKGNYHALVVPYAPFVSRSLLVFFEKLAIKGTTLIFIDEPPVGTLEDGAGNASVTTRLQKLVAPKRESVAIMAPADLDHALSGIKPEISLLRESGESAEVAAQAYHGESAGGSRIILLHNLSDTAEQTVIAELPIDKYFTVLDCTTGKMTELEPIDIERNIARLRLCFTPLQTLMVITSSAKVPTIPVAPPTATHELNPFTLPLRSYRIVFKNEWIFEPKTLNALPLSNWTIRMGMSRESGQISHFYETTFEVKSPFDLDYCMFIMSGLSNAGLPFQNSELMFNGIRIDSEPMTASDDPMVRDNPIINALGKGMPLYDLKRRLTKGLNRVSIRTTGNAISPQTLTYPPLVIGDFAVTKGPHGWSLDKPVEPIVGHESWVKHGYPYLSGRARYEQTFEVPNEYDRLILRFSKTSGTVYVKVNGVDAGMLNWHPMELDITELCNSQRNDLSVEVVNTMDNVMRLSGRPSGLTGEVYVDVYKT